MLGTVHLSNELPTGPDKNIKQQCLILSHSISQSELIEAHSGGVHRVWQKSADCQKVFVLQNQENT